LWFKQKTKIFFFLSSPLFVGVLAVLFLSTVNAVNIPEALYGDIKALEFIFFGYYTYRFFQYHSLKPLFYIFSLSAFIVSLLAVVQFFLQRSVGSVFYFLGERTFTASTLGIATFPLQGHSVLRPYATFPHPNVLAFFLLFSLVIIVLGAVREKDSLRKVGMWSVCFLSSVALLLTFSRVTLLCFLLLFGFFCFFSVKEREKRVLFIVVFFGMMVFCLPLLVGRLFDIPLLYRDLFFRESLASISFSILQKNLFFGVGLNNFFFHELPFQKTISPIFLQPVHSIYLFIASETGIAGLLLFVWFLVKTFLRDRKKVVSNFQHTVFLLLLCALFIGLFDHFLLTLQQGQLMFSFLLGLVWSVKGARKKDLLSF
jgi:O-antigen ligase